MVEHTTSISALLEGGETGVIIVLEKSSNFNRKFSRKYIWSFPEIMFFKLQASENVQEHKKKPKKGVTGELKTLKAKFINNCCGLLSQKTEFLYFFITKILSNLPTFSDVLFT